MSSPLGLPQATYHSIELAQVHNETPRRRWAVVITAGLGFVVVLGCLVLASQPESTTALLGVATTHMPTTAKPLAPSSSQQAAPKASVSGPRGPHTLHATVVGGSSASLGSSSNAQANTEIVKTLEANDVPVEPKITTATATATTSAKFLSNRMLGGLAALMALAGLGSLLKQMVPSPRGMKFAAMAMDSEDSRKKTEGPKAPIVPKKAALPQPAKKGSANEWKLASIGRAMRVEGSSREHWEFPDPEQEVVQVAIDSNGRPIESLIELWIGPDWTPMKVKAYSEDGMLRPIQALIGTRNKAAAIDINNTGPPGLPLNAAAAYASPSLVAQREQAITDNEGKYIEGGAVYTANFPPKVNQIAVLLYTDSRQLNAQVELLNGPNTYKQKFEVFTNNGLLNSLYIVFETPGAGNVVRITNLAPLEFPCKAFITPL